MRTTFGLAFLFLTVVVVIGCSQEKEDRAGGNPLNALQEQIDEQEKVAVASLPPKTDLIILDNGEPNYVTVEHILISFKEVYKTDASRSKEEAEKLADEIFERAKEGESFSALYEKYSDDTNLSYVMANHGQKSFESKIPDLTIHARHNMVTSFGDVGFSLEEDEIGLAEFDEEKCKYGWHIIRRMK